MPNLRAWVDCLRDLNYRIYTRDAPISTDSLVCLVGSRPTSWQSGAPYISFLLPHRLLSKGQVAWPLIASFSCPTTSPPSPCPRSENQGWRYFLYAMGGFMLVLFVIRFFIFHLYESPKFLMGRGRDAEAVEVVHKVAAYNGTTSNITLDMLRRVERNCPACLNYDSEKPPISVTDTSRLGALHRILQEFGWDHITPLFQTRKLAWSTSLLITLWGTRFLRSAPPLADV